MGKKTKSVLMLLVLSVVLFGFNIVHSGMEVKADTTSSEIDVNQKVQEAIQGQTVVKEVQSANCMMRLYSNGYLIVIAIPGTDGQMYNKADYSDYSLRDATNIIVADGVTVVGKAMFEEFNKPLKSVLIAGSVREIGDRAFSKSTIENITILSGVQIIGCNAFEGTKIEHVVLPESVKSVKDNAFRECSLSGIVLPNTITEIHSRTFENCANLQQITIPNCVSIIGQYAFHGCSNLKSIYLPENLKSIGMSAFQDCGNLQNIDLPYGVEKIETAAFYNCKSIKNICFPDSAINLGASVAAECSSLGTVELPKNINRVPDGMFCKCAKLSNVILPDKIKAIGTYAFSQCTSLTNINIPDGVTNIQQYAFSESGLTSISFPDSVKTIGEEAFCWTKLQQTVLDLNKIEYVGAYAFYSLPNINVIYGYNVKSSGKNSFYLYYNERNNTTVYTTKNSCIDNVNYWVEQGRMATIDTNPPKLPDPVVMYAVNHEVGDRTDVPDSKIDKRNNPIRAYGEFNANLVERYGFYSLASYTYSEFFFDHPFSNINGVPDITLAEATGNEPWHMEAAEVYLVGAKVKDANGNIVDYGTTDNGCGYFAGIAYNRYGYLKFTDEQRAAENNKVVAGRDYSGVKGSADGNIEYTTFDLPNEVVSADAVLFVDVTDRYYSIVNAATYDDMRDGYDLDGVRVYYQPEK